MTGSLLRIVHDYGWELQSENLSGTLNFSSPVVARSNLVLLLSPISRSLRCLAEFMNVDMDNELLLNVDAFCEKFRETFSAVNHAYVDRDIHCSWIDVKFDAECSEEKAETDEPVLEMGIFRNGIRSLGWGFCSSDSIILGSALIPFELIYSTIGISLNSLYSNDLCKPINAQLSLEISDVRGKPLECNCCDLELLNLKNPARLMPADIVHTLELGNLESEALEQDKRFHGRFDHGNTKLHIKSVQECNEDVRITAYASNLILVQSHSRESGKSKKKRCSNFFADRVLDILSSEMGNFIDRETTPIWHILLSFLCRKGYRALVSLSNGNGESFMGILKPYTAHLALLSILDDGYVMESQFRGLEFPKLCDNVCKLYAVMDNANKVSSQSGTLSSKNNVPLGDPNRKKNRKHVYQDLTWISFYKAAFECSGLELEEAYFTCNSTKSKKLKFLKCWMKQITKGSSDCLAEADESKSSHHIGREIEERVTGTDQDSEQSIPLFSSDVPSKVQAVTPLVSCSETSESFFSNLPTRIRDGLESKGVDLQILAERVVKLSIYWLYQKYEADNSMENKSPTVKSDDSRDKIVGGKLTKLLLKEPKEMKEKHKDNDPSISVSDSRSTSFPLENIVREYELQVLLRMEILRSEVAATIDSSTKRKLVKQICLLLDIIQYIVEGGFHGHLSLHDYVEKTIKTRYSHVLGNVVNKIYAQMDLLPYSDENEYPNLLLNSEDSNHSWREKDRCETAEINRIPNSISADDESSQPLELDLESPPDVKRVEHVRKLSEAQERRERARRFVSFTTWVPDLQRVWAPKQPPKAIKAKSDSLKRRPKRKERSRGNRDVVCETPAVCETPMMGNKHNGTNTSISVSKALFQDDG